MDRCLMRTFRMGCHETTAMHQLAPTGDQPLANLLGTGKSTAHATRIPGSVVRCIRRLQWTSLPLVSALIGWPVMAGGQDLPPVPPIPPQPRPLAIDVIVEEAPILPADENEAHTNAGKDTDKDKDKDANEQAGGEREQAEPEKAPPADPPALAALVPQVETQYDAMLQSELHLAFLIGQFRKAEREAIEKEARAGYRSMMREMAEMRLPRQANVRQARAVGGIIRVADPAGVVQAVVNPNMPGMRATTATSSDIPSQLERLIADAMSQHASPEKVAQFHQEREKRTARLKQVIISNIVTGLDEKLLLSPAQRQEVTDLLDKHWDSPNPQLLDQFTYPNDNGWLPIPDNLIHSALTPSQRRVWIDRRRQHTVIFNAVGGVGMQNFRIDDSMWKGFDRDQQEVGQ